MALGLSAGDRVHDTIQDTLGVVSRSGTIVSVDEYNATYSASPVELGVTAEKIDSRRTWLIWLNLAVLFCAATYAASRYLRTSRKL